MTDRVMTEDEVQALARKLEAFYRTLGTQEQVLFRGLVVRAARLDDEVQGYQMDLTQLQQTQLQMTLDRQSQVMGMLSNTLQLMNATGQAITGNLK